MKKRHIIIGTSAAGLSAARRLAMLVPQDEIICISDEVELPYNKCHLASYLAGEKQESEVLTVQETELGSKGITFKLGVRVIKIDTHAKEIICNDGIILTYDTLFIGTGSSPKLPPLAGINHYKNIFTFHSLADTQQLMQLQADGALREAVIIGAGLSGLECADALRMQGVTVHVLELRERVLSAQVNDAGAALIQEKMRECGIHFYPNVQVTQILDRDDVACGVRLADGRSINADLIIVATGLKANTELLANTAIERLHGHVLINECMQTSVPDVYAGGDVCMVIDQITGALIPSRTWSDAMLQGLTAAYNMAGAKRAYPGTAVITSSAFFGLKFATCGQIMDIPLARQVQEVHALDSYQLLVLEDGLIKGFLLVGDTSKLPLYRRLLLTKQPFTL